MPVTDYFRSLFGGSKNNTEETEHKEEKISTGYGDVFIQREPVGSSGTESYAGYNSEDYFQKLHGSNKAKEFDKMRRSDPQIKMCLSSVKNPIRRSTVEIQTAKGDDSDQGKLEAEFIEHVLFQDMDTPWKKFLGEALTICDFGHAVFEVTHKNVLNGKFAPYTGIRDLSWRSPKTIERWNLHPDSGKLDSIDQYAYGDLDRLVNINSKYLMVMTLEMEGSNYEGFSLLRPCYGNHFRKNNYLKLNAIGIEKGAVPTPTAEIPEGQESGKQYDNLILALQKYTTHQSNYLTYPAGWKIDLNPNAYDPQKVEVSIDNEDKRMVKAFLANFLELGSSGSGSYALSNDLSDFFLSGIEYIAEEIAEKINREVIIPLIKMNFGERETYPTLKFSGISDKAGKELAEILGIMVDKKIIIPDGPLETHARKRFGVTEKSDEDQRKVEPSSGLPMSLSEKVENLNNKDRGNTWP